MAKTIRAIKNERRRRFKAALALAGMTHNQWAEQQGVTADHVRFVLGGRESGRLEQVIDAFIAKHLPAHTSAAV